LHGIKACDGDESSDGIANGTEGHRRGIGDETEDGGSKRIKAETDHHGAADGNGSSAPTGTFENGTQGTLASPARRQQFLMSVQQFQIAHHQRTGEILDHATAVATLRHQRQVQMRAAIVDLEKRLEETEEKAHMNLADMRKKMEA
jgi:hypothetical protein